MKRLLICLLALPMLFSACNKPKEIPDDKLIAIVGDLFLANAYWSSTLMADSLRTDSVNIYAPIFDRYGYRPQDFIHTIGTLSKRKSVRLTDVIEKATDRLKQQSAGYFAQVAMMDTLEQIAAERYKQVVYGDTSLRLSRLSQPDDKPDITVPLEAGRYRIEYTYLIDTADRNSYVQYMQFLLDTADRRSHYNYRSFTKGRERREKIEVEVPDTTALKTLNIFLAYSSSKDSKKTLITVDSLRITRFMPPEAALDSLTRRILYPSPLPEYPHAGFDLPTADTAHVRTFEKDFVTLRVDTAGMAALADSVVR